MSNLLQDVRYAIRTLLKAPGFTAIAILTLALGIGANTAIFSVVYTSLLRPLPFPHANQLVDVWGHSAIFDFPNLGLSLPDIADIRSQNRVFADIAPYNYSTTTLTGHGAPQQLESGKVSLEFFPLLGIKPLYGRIFTRAEMQPGQDREVILSYELWQKQFGADPRALGKGIMLDGDPYAIIGVMPPQQDVNFVTSQKLWLPLAPTPKELAERDQHGTPALARLLPGRTIPEAQAELDAIGARLAKTYPDADKNWGFRVASLETDSVGDARLSLLILLGAVGFVLLIACANVGNLFLSRGWTRRRELAIRSALGATRRRLIRQLLVESLLVALVGGACGLLLAVWGVAVLRNLLPPDTPRVEDLAISQAVLWFTLGASIFAGILFGLAPAILASRQELSSVIKEGGAGAQTGASGTRHKVLRHLLVVGEVALALTLVIGATLALRSFARLSSVDLGFRPDHLLTMRITFPSGQYTKPEQYLPYAHQIVTLVRETPGVEGAAGSLYVPFSSSKGETEVHLESAPSTAQPPMCEGNQATPGYFQALGIPLLAGRDFTAEDTANSPPVFIVNQAFAKKFFGKQNPIGKRMWDDKDEKKNPKWGQIVGEVANFRDQGSRSAPEPYLFVPYGTGTGPVASYGIALVVRTKADPLALVSGIRERIETLNQQQAVADVESMDKLIMENHAQPRFETFLLGLFGALGLVLALVGIYGVISYSVTQRTREIGIRMALGAEPAGVMRLVLAHGLKLALIGVAIGIAASLGLTRLMSSLLFGVSATDPLTFAGVTILLVVVSLAACYIPARRAMRVDPMVALRYE
jgi:putative ABC transport system permease protein